MDLTLILNQIEPQRFKLAVIDALQRLLPEQPPERSRRAKRPTVVRPSETIKRFIADCCELTAAGEVAKHALYQKYCLWCEARGLQQLTRHIFSKVLFVTEPLVTKTRTFIHADGKKLCTYRGIRLKVNP